MLKKILIGIVVLIAALCVYAALLPSEFHFARETKINSPAAVVFPHVNNLRKMDAWNPWMKLDPQAKINYSGPEAGVGSTSSWEGNKDVGQGSITITESVPNSLVRLKLDYIKPFESTSVVEFILKSEGNQASVSWGISGHSPFIHRLLCMFMSMEKMMGDMFDKGLAELKAVSETAK